MEDIKDSSEHCKPERLSRARCYGRHTKTSLPFTNCSTTSYCFSFKTRRIQASQQRREQRQLAVNVAKSDVALSIICRDLRDSVPIIRFMS